MWDHDINDLIEGSCVINVSIKYGNLFWVEHEGLIPEWFEVVVGYVEIDSPVSVVCSIESLFIISGDCADSVHFQPELLDSEPVGVVLDDVVVGWGCEDVVSYTESDEDKKSEEDASHDVKIGLTVLKERLVLVGEDMVFKLFYVFLFVLQIDVVQLPSVQSVSLYPLRKSVLMQ